MTCNLYQIQAVSEQSAAICTIDVRNYFEICKERFQYFATNPETLQPFAKEAQFKQYRVALAQLFHESSWGKGKIWNDIKDKISHTLKGKPTLSSNEQILLNSVLSPLPSNQPLAIETLNQTFDEFAMNSIDALLESFLFKSSRSTTVVIQTELSILNNALTISVSDNCGGFSKEYIKKFEQLKTISEKDGIRECLRGGEGSSQKKDYYEYFLGRQGCGMKMALSWLLEGVEFDKWEKHRKWYDVLNKTTDLCIYNNNEGAVIELTSPLEPFESVIHNRSLASSQIKTTNHSEPFYDSTITSSLGEHSILPKDTSLNKDSNCVIASIFTKISQVNASKKRKRKPSLISTSSRPCKKEPSISLSQETEINHPSESNNQKNNSFFLVPKKPHAEPSLLNEEDNKTQFSY